MDCLEGQINAKWPEILKIKIEVRKYKIILKMLFALLISCFM